MVLEAASTLDDVLKCHFSTPQSVSMPESLPARIGFVIPGFQLESLNEISGKGLKKEKEEHGRRLSYEAADQNGELNKHNVNHHRIFRINYTDHMEDDLLSE